MAHYIDKDALVAEIDNILEYADEHWDTDYAIGAQRFANKLQDTINTLEVKEVNNVWHEAIETPKGAGDKEILVQFTDSRASVFEIDDWEYLDHQTKWAYLKDLI